MVGAFTPSTSAIRYFDMPASRAAVTAFGGWTAERARHDQDGGDHPLWGLVADEIERLKPENAQPCRVIQLHRPR
jgi:hypothetical protein